MTNDYPERVCPACGESFKPKTKRQIYDKDYCRVKANRAKHIETVQPMEVNWMLEEIRRVHPDGAHRIEQLALTVAKQVSEELIFVTYQIMKRGAIVEAKNVLLEAGEIQPKRRKTNKPAKT